MPSSALGAVATLVSVSNILSPPAEMCCVGLSNGGYVSPIICRATDRLLRRRWSRPGPGYAVCYR